MLDEEEEYYEGEEDENEEGVRKDSQLTIYYQRNNKFQLFRSPDFIYLISTIQQRSYQANTGRPQAAF